MTNNNSHARGDRSLDSFSGTLRFRLSKLLLISSLIYGGYTFAGDKYFLCGPDEDRCYEDIYQYCACIPLNEKEGNKAYCLDFDAMRCRPLSQMPDCYPEMIFKNQGSCLSTIFQSEADPPCPLTTKSFCLEHNTYLCDEDGHPGSCRKK